jgi:nucleotide-binding universal stress UspA family protein
MTDSRDQGVYKHILIPLENSGADDAILTHIRPLARLTQARITLIHVADGFMARNQHRLGESEEMRRDQEYLDRRKAELTSDGFAVDAVLACGDPAREILALVEAEKCDLIAMSTHGHRLLSDFVLGSVATEVRHRARVPVLLLRA